MNLRDELIKLWLRRDMVRNLVVRDLKIRYKASLLGFIWSFLNPIILMAIYYLVFAVIAKDWRNTVTKAGMPYSVFLITGVWHWMLFTGAVSKSAPLFILNESLVKKVYFPREILPISVVISEFMNFLFGLLVIFIASAIFGLLFNWYVLFYPIFLLILFMFTMGFSFLVSVWDVYFRDTEQILNSLLTIGFFASPILYSIDTIHEKFFSTNDKMSPLKIELMHRLSGLYYSNPFATLIPYIRRSLLGSEVDIKIPSVVILFLSAFLFLLFSYWYFKRHEYRLVEEV